MAQILIQCPECKGTGLYKGMCEQDECAVECTKCHGTGFIYFQYEPFEARKERTNVKRVFKKTCGFVHSDKNCTCQDGTVLHFEDYGCTYGEWLNGEEPKPMEELYCPYLYYNKGIGSEPLDKCRKNLELGMRIPECQCYGEKEKCWKEFHEKEN